ncbi:MAG: hypothetical protein GWM92_11285 [Gemmatimonadetes bacterium]|nr:hypothetical protein [Gemmatimonadota bacterium]NIR41518.1 hypothetical protein [Actinomycetota bacterium]NIU74727.1 hypothetical protein [Gammaproteobacteria bacterium]NIR79276.1 hypothetical protein [Gemmatimonadota bacterium]NIT87935.1 hypothetical protein [Gemmatimonadota bacterium]
MEGGQTVRFTSVALVQGATHLTPKPGDSGDQQRDTVLATLEPFRVIARDHHDAPVAGVTVKWSAYADGSLDIRTSVTDDDGVAETRYRLPTQAGTLRVQASVEGLIGSPIAFEAHAEPATPTNLVIVSGDEQVALPSSSLAPYAVRAIDAYGNAVEGVVIDWEITEGGGSIDPARSTTSTPDAATQRPLAMTTHTLSPIEGSHVVTATATSVPGTPRATFRSRAVSGIVWVYTYYYYGWNNAYSGFEPDEIVVPAGGTVAWLWGPCDWGCDDHDVTFEDDPTEPASSPTQREGTHFRTFDQPGVFPYHCSVHSGEGGMVEVVAGGAG